MSRITALLMHRHSITAVALIFLLGVATALFVAAQEEERLEEIGARHYAENISQFIREFRNLYTSEVASRLGPHGIEIRHDYQNIDGATPLPATFTLRLLKRISLSGNGLDSARLYSDYPFPWRKNIPLDAFERAALAALKADPTTPFVRVEARNGKRRLRYASADIMRESCLGCHNSRPDSPKKDWKLGDVRGVLEINVPLDRAEELATEGMSGMHLAVGALILSGLIGFVTIGIRLRRHAELLEFTVEERTKEIKSLARFPEEDPLPVMRASPSNHLLYMNPATGYLAHHFELEVGRKLPDPFSAHCDKARKQNSDVEFEIHAGERWYLMMVSASSHDEVSIYGFEITERKQAEQKLQHLDRVKSLGVLAGGIAHDFNNILATIFGNVGLALMKTDDKNPVKKHLQQIEIASKRAADLCKQMLAYSGRGKFVVLPIDLSEAVRETMQMLSTSIPRHVTCKMALDGNLPPVEGDNTQIQQLIMNLIINAYEAIGDEQGVLSLTTGTVHVDRGYLQSAHAADGIQPGEFVFLEVSDSGCGMDEEVKQHLFDPFFTTKFTGRGLGMSALLGIVRGHHGAIHIDSEPGQGTRIRVLFPPLREQMATTQAIEPNDVKKADDRDTGATILIIDDEETIREAAAAILEDVGYRTLSAENGEQGVALYRAHQQEIAAVLLDMTMPNMDGRECFAELQRINPDVRVILSSGYDEQEATSHFDDHALAAFVQKPYFPERLQAVVAQVCNQPANP